MRSPSQPGHRAGGHLGGALDQRCHMGALAASVCSSRPRPTRLARLTERRQPLAPEGSVGQHIEPRIEGLGRELFPHVVRIRVSEASGNLFRRAALSQLCLDILPQPGGQECARSSWLAGLRVAATTRAA